MAAGKAGVLAVVEDLRNRHAATANGPQDKGFDAYAPVGSRLQEHIAECSLGFHDDGAAPRLVHVGVRAVEPRPQDLGRTLLMSGAGALRHDLSPPTDLGIAYNARASGSGRTGQDRRLGMCQSGMRAVSVPAKNGSPSAAAGILVRPRLDECR